MISINNWKSIPPGLDIYGVAIPRGVTRAIGRWHPWCH